MNRGLDGRVGRLSESADRSIPHRHANLIEERDLRIDTAERLADGDAMQCFLLAYRAHTTGYALPARFVAEKRRDSTQDRRHVHAIVKHEDNPGTERGLGRARALEGERHVEVLRTDEDTRRATEKDRLKPACARHTAGELDHLAQRAPERDLVNA